MKKLNIGLIGYGFMGRAHSNAFRQAGRFFPAEHEVVLKAVCGRDAARVREFARIWGYEGIETDWRRLVERRDIDLIDIATPNCLHAEMAVAAALAGKMVFCEKPLAMNPGEAADMVRAVEQARVPNMVWFNYRHLPAVMLARNLVAEGRIGRVFHIRSRFLQDWTISADVPIGGAGAWRLDADAAGSGVTGDLLAHCIDASLWLNGPIERVTAATETFVRQRMRGDGGRLEKVRIDDASAFLARFANGSMATFEATRFACGHKAQFTLEINGERGSLAWDLTDLNWLRFFEAEAGDRAGGWKSISVTDVAHPYMARWWASGVQIGYEHSFIHQFADFVAGLSDGGRRTPDFRDGLATDEVVGAVLRSARSGLWERPAGRE